MQIIKYNLRIEAVPLIMIALLFAGSARSSLAITPEQASEQIKTMPCKESMTVDQILDQSIRSHSQRDIGWRTFQEEGYMDIERAVLINKGMELKYRWRVQMDGSISAQNDRATALCEAG